MSPSFWRKRAFEHNFEDTGVTFFRHHSKLLHLWRVHDRLDHRQQNLDDQSGRDILAHHSQPLPIDKKFSHVALDERGPATLDEFENVGRFLAHIAYKKRPDLV